MQIRFTSQANQATRNKPAKGAAVQSESKEASNGGILDRFRPTYDKLDIHLDQPEYKNIQDLEAANMLGHFTQTMQNNGYPWKLLSADKLADGSFKKGKDISDMEALNRLRKGEGILLQPMRDLQLDLSSGSITAIAAAGSAASTDMTGLTKVANYSKNAQVQPEMHGLGGNMLPLWGRFWQA